MGFWNFPNYSKLDVLEEDKYEYNELILEALCDKETCVEVSDGEHDYIIYGDQEALLLRSTSVVLRVGMFVYCYFLTFLKNKFHSSDTFS